jgi:hypothetical protein
VFGSFGAGDSLSVYRLQRKGVSLDLKRDLTRPYAPLREAWLAFLTQQAMGQPTYVLRDLYEGEGFVQIRYRPHQTAADVVFVAPALEEDRGTATTWLDLLDGVCIEAAGRGIQRMFANLPQEGADGDMFRRAGFTPYAGEDVYRLSRATTRQQPAKLAALRPQRPEDWPAMQKLCVSITPQRVRQAEGGLDIALGQGDPCLRYVVAGAQEDDLLATLDLYPGGLAHWLRVLVHPESRDVIDDLIRWGVLQLDVRSSRPIYCNVRQYESGVRAALESTGFEPLAARTLMVKHTVAWAKVPAQELVPALKGNAEPVPPAYRINGESEFQTSNGR